MNSTGVILPTPKAPPDDEFWSLATTGQDRSNCQSRCYSEVLRFDAIRTTPTPPLGRIPHGKYAADYRHLLERKGDAEVSKLTKIINNVQRTSVRQSSTTPTLPTETEDSRAPIHGARALQHQEAVASDLTTILDRYKHEISQQCDPSYSGICALIKDTDRAGERYFYSKEAEQKKGETWRPLYPPSKPIEHRMAKKSIFQYQSPRVVIATKLKELRGDNEALAVFDNTCSQVIEQRRKTYNRKWITLNKRQCSSYRPNQRLATLTKYFDEEKAKHERARNRRNNTFMKDMMNKKTHLFLSSCDGNRARKLIPLIHVVVSAKRIYDLHLWILHNEHKRQERLRLQVRNNEKRACVVLGRELWRFLLHQRICRKRCALAHIKIFISSLSKRSQFITAVSKYIKSVRSCQNAYRLRKIRKDARLMVWGLQWMRCENIIRAEYQPKTGKASRKKKKAERISIDVGSLKKMVHMPTCPVDLRNSVLLDIHDEVISHERALQEQYEAELAFYRIRMEQYQSVSFNVPEPVKPPPPVVCVLLPKKKIMHLVSTTYKQLSDDSREKVRKNIASEEPSQPSNPDWA